MSPSRAGVRVVGSDPGDDETEPVVAVERRRPNVLVVALVVVALLGVFGTVFYFNRWRHLDNRNRAAGQVTAASSLFLNALTNFNANNIDATVQHLQDMSTGNFKDQAGQFFSTDVRQRMAKVQATSRGQIHYLYVESIDADTATTYAEVDQTIANLNFSRPEQDVLRVALTLKKLSVGWRISEVTVLQGPATVAPSPTTTTTTK